MAVEIIITCDHCGSRGHNPERPAEDCIVFWKKRVRELEDEINNLHWSYRKHLVIR